MYLIGKSIASLGKDYRAVGLVSMILITLMLALQLWSLM